MKSTLKEILWQFLQYLGCPLFFGQVMVTESDTIIFLNRIVCNERLPLDNTIIS